MISFSQFDPTIDVTVKILINDTRDVAEKKIFYSITNTCTIQKNKSLIREINIITKGLVTLAIAFHMHGLSHGCSCVLSVSQDLLQSCNCHAPSPDYHATCKLRHKTHEMKHLLNKLVTKSQMETSKQP